MNILFVIGSFGTSALEGDERKTRGSRRYTCVLGQVWPHAQSTLTNLWVVGDRRYCVLEVDLMRIQHSRHVAVFCDGCRREESPGYSV